MLRSRRSERPCDYGARLEDLSVTDYKRILQRRKGALLLITCLAIFGASLITSPQPRVYESRALLEIQSLNENFRNFRDIYPPAASNVESGSYVQTQGELLQQDSLIEEVARNLDLEKRPKFQPPSDLLGKLLQDIRIALLRNSRIIQIVCDACDAALAASLANTLVQVFIEKGIDARQHTAPQTYESLRLQLEYADARMMARYSDGLVLVVRPNYTNQKTAQAVALRLKNDGTRVTGIILNRRDQFRSDVYGYRAFRGTRSASHRIGNRSYDLYRRV